MPPEPTGHFSVEDPRGRHGAFRIRFRVRGQRHREVLHERSGCDCGCGGGWDERAARAELGNVLARVRAGVWKPRERPAPPARSDSPVPTFHEYASAWLAAKRRGCSATSRSTPTPRPTTAGASPATCSRTSRRIPSIRSTPSSASRSRPQAQGGDRDPRRARRRRRPARPPRATSAAAVGLLDPQADRHARRDPRRGPRGRPSTATPRAGRMRVRVPKPPRTLPRDGRARRAHRGRRRAGRVAGRSRVPRTARPRAATSPAWPRRQRPSDIAAELGLAKATVTHHLRRSALRARSPTPAAARSSRRSGAAASASASCATCASASSASTTATPAVSASPTPRPRPASARCR